MTTTSSTSSSTTTQSLVSALGGGSGIDMAALASNLAAAQFSARTHRLSAKSDTLNAQISSASNIKSMLLNLSTAMGQRVRAGDLSPQPRLTNAAVATAGLSGTRQPGGTFSLEVTTLAAAQTLASAAYTAETASVGSGTLTLRFGAIAGGAFTADSSRSQVDIPVAGGATLADVASAINGANAGVSAYVATTADGAKLVLKGQEGAANGFILEASENASDPGLSKLAWTPASTTGQLVRTAGDAAFKVDGIARTYPSNTVAEAIPGVTLTLAATNAGAPTTVTFTDASAAITTAMTDLTSALNEIASALGTATDPTSGDLRADGGARALRRGLGQLAGASVMPNATGAARTLADLGLSTQRDGTFALDGKRLAATLAADPKGAAAMFTNGLYGVYASVDKLYRTATAAGDPGSLGGSIGRLAKQLKQVTSDKSDLVAKQETLRATLASRFAVADARIGDSKSTLSFIQNQIAAWNKGN